VACNSGLLQAELPSGEGASQKASVRDWGLLLCAADVVGAFCLGELGHSPVMERLFYRDVGSIPDQSPDPQTPRDWPA
jgi:hypothetical protein